MNRTDAVADPARADSVPVHEKNIRPRSGTFRLSLYRMTFLPYVLFFVVWELFARVNTTFGLFNPRFLPPPTMLLEEGWKLA